MRSLLVVLSVAVITSSAHAQASPWATETFRSSRLNEERTFFVATPASYGSSRTSYPVLVLLDAEDTPQFNAAVANAAFLASRAAIPDMIVVGIPNGRDRTHDLTPTATGSTAKSFPSAGGASAFAAFIIDEVLPKVRAKYRTLPSTVLAGHSFGGLLALDVAATRPGAFNGIIAMSPSLWWNDSIPARDYASAIAATSATTRLFTTSGGLEAAIAVTTKRFISRLDSIKPTTLAFASQHYPENTHGLTPEPSLIDGLRFVYAPVSLLHAPVQKIDLQSDSATIVSAVTETEEQYARAARSLGLPDHLPESQVNEWGYGVLKVLKMPNVAVWIFRKNVANHPDSPSAHASLAEGLLAVGDTAAARTQFRSARDVASRVGQPLSEEMRKKLDVLDRGAVQAGKAKP
jgi:predicted alpha/beta superfamily hydrolase